MRDEILQGDCLKVLSTLEDESVDCVITSPPYWGLRDYGVDGQLGLEETPEEYVSKLVSVFREVKRVLKKDGTLWLNLGDSYAGSGKGQTKDGSNDPKVRKTQGMKLPIHRESKNSFGMGGRHKTSQHTLRSYEQGHAPGLKPKDLVGIPWRVAFALHLDGWYLRQDIIWAKPNPMPESVTDRCTKSHEYIFLLSKNEHYYFANEEIKENTLTNDNSNRDRDKQKLNNTPGRTKMGGLKTNNYERRNKRSVWLVGTKPYTEAHFATFPEKLIEPMVLAGCPLGGVILDPFMGAGTTAIVSKKLGRNYLGIELNPEYVKLAEQRLKGITLPMFE